MFNRKPKTESDLDAEIASVFNDLRGYETDSEAYAKCVTQLEALYKLKTIDRSERVSPDTLATISANLLGIVLIVGHERAHVVTSKAIGFVRKLG